jgi:hypothetical protein
MGPKRRTSMTESTTSDVRTGNTIQPMKVTNGMPDWVAMSMFCGLPTRVSAQPTLDPQPSASTNGSTGRRRSFTTPSNRGASSTHTVSFTSTAESSPATYVVPTSSARAEWACRSSRRATAAKKPPTSKWPLMSMVPNSSTSVSWLTTLS